MYQRDFQALILIYPFGNKDHSQECHLILGFNCWLILKFVFWKRTWPYESRLFV